MGQAIGEVRALEKPYRPVSVKVINRVGSCLGAIGIKPIKLDKDLLLVNAKAQTGLGDFGDESFQEGLQVFINSLKEDADLTLIGEIMAKTMINDLLVNRLKIIDWRKKHPEVAEQEIKRPLFVLGMPRTGSTILQALLDVDPANRSPLTWEVTFPVPPVRPETVTSDPRIAASQQNLNKVLNICPSLPAAHPVGAMMPQECTGILAMDFKSQQFSGMFNVWDYSQWFRNTPMEYSYQWHKMVLQHFQSAGVAGERWLLKAPGHLNKLDTLFRVYPDANVIQTHRDPVRVCTSASSLVALLVGIGTDKIKHKQIGALVLEGMERQLKQNMEQRDRHKDKAQQFFDVNLNETVTDPIGTVEKIYKHFGYQLSSAAEAAMKQYMQDNSSTKHGVHTYVAADFGIDEIEDRKRFREYEEYFDL